MEIVIIIQDGTVVEAKCNVENVKLTVLDLDLLEDHDEALVEYAENNPDYVDLILPDPQNKYYDVLINERYQHDVSVQFKQS